MDFTRWSISRALQFRVAETNRCTCVWEGLEKEARPLLVPVHGLWEKSGRSCTNHSENGVSTCSCLSASYTWNLGEFFFFSFPFFFPNLRIGARAVHMRTVGLTAGKLYSRASAALLHPAQSHSLIFECRYILRKTPSGGFQVPAPAKCVLKKDSCQSDTIDLAPTYQFQLV